MFVYKEDHTRLLERWKINNKTYTPVEEKAITNNLKYLDSLFLHPSLIGINK